MVRNRFASIGLGIAALFAAPLALEAQDVTIGVKGGVNVADLSIDEDGTDVETDTKSGIVGGVWAQFGISDIFAIRPEGLFSQKGTKSDIDGLQFEAEIDYIEVPVLLVARVPTGGSVRPYALAGPVISFETTCEIEIEGLGGEVSEDCETFDPEDPILTKGTDFGVAFGGGVEIETGKLVWLADGRYTLGLTDINDTEAAPESYKNRAWSFTAGVGIRVN